MLTNYRKWKPASATHTLLIPRAVRAFEERKDERDENITIRLPHLEDFLAEQIMTPDIKNVHHDSEGDSYFG